MRWYARRVRTWVTLAAMVVAPLLAGRDGRLAWAFFVALMTILLGGLSLNHDYDLAHPERGERRAAKEQARVDAILAKYEQERSRQGRHRQTP